MTEESLDWTRIQAVFESAIELQPADRDEYLSRACGTDAAMRKEVESLLAFHTTHGELSPLQLRQALEDRWRTQLTARLPGTTVGRFQVGSEIGRGGHSVVFEGIEREQDFEHRVAIKIIAPTATTESTKERFRRERQAQVGVSHPFVAVLVDTGFLDSGEPFLVIEHVDGKPITQYVAGRKMDTDAVLDLFGQVCSAVGYAHSSAVIHRDIKPANVLVVPSGEPKLLDFGISRLIDADGPDTADGTGSFAMTPAYAAPEQLTGGPTTAATDVYALGILLYELLTGRNPQQFRDGESWFAFIDRITKTPIQKPTQSGLDQAPVADRRELGRLFDAGLNEILERAVAREPSERYENVQQLTDDMVRLRSNYPVHARKNTRRYRMACYVRRHKVSTGILGTFAIMLVAVVVATRSQVSRITLERNRANTLADFMVDVFRTADPDMAGGRTITAAELLDNGARQVTEGSIDSTSRTLFADAIGRANRGLGRFDEAEQLAELAVSFCSARPSEICAVALQNLGVVENIRAKPDTAERTHRSAIAMLERMRGSELAIARVQNDLATVFETRGEYAEMEEIARKVLQTYSERDEATTVDMANAHTTLGNSLYHQDRTTEAIPHFREALNLRRAEPRMNRPMVAQAFNNLGEAFRKMRALAEAEEMLDSALAIRRDILPEGHRDIGTVLNNLALVRFGLGDTLGALNTSVEALAIFDKVFGRLHPSTAVVRGNVAALQSARGLDSLAYNTLVELLADQLQMLGEDHGAVARTHHNLGSVRRNLGLFAEAILSFQEALRIRGLPGTDNSAYASSLDGLATTYELLGLLDRAEDMYREVISIYRALPESPAMPIGRTMSKLGRTLVKLGRRDEGLRVLENALAVFVDANLEQSSEGLAARSLLDSLAAGATPK